MEYKWLNYLSSRCTHTTVSVSQYVVEGQRKREGHLFQLKDTSPPHSSTSMPSTLTAVPVFVHSNLSTHNKQFIMFWRKWQSLKVYSLRAAELTRARDLSLGSRAPEGIIGLIEVSFVGQVTTFKIQPDLELSLLLRQPVYISSFYLG